MLVDTSNNEEVIREEEMTASRRIRINNLSKSR